MVNVVYSRGVVSGVVSVSMVEKGEGEMEREGEEGDTLGSNVTTK